MNKMKPVLILTLMFVTLVFFQNCTPARFHSLLNDAVSSKGAQPDSTGQPYDGKIYVVTGATCPDGTYVQSRIILKSLLEATLVRENCKDVNQTLSSADFHFNQEAPDQLVYKNKTYMIEQPWTPIPLMSTWYYQLTGVLQTNNALVYNIDLFDTSAATISSLKQAGHIVICNFSSGTYEDWRSDTASFLPSDLGNAVTGSSGENWLDIRSSSVRAAMVNRLELARNKGCDGVSPDSADGYTYNTGFPLSSLIQVDYNEFIAFAAHDRRLIVALKNNPDLVDQLVDVYDFSIAEQCFQYSECSLYQPFIFNGKAVLAAEFTAMSAAQCKSAQDLSFSLAYFNQALNGNRYQQCQ